jgi:exosortase A-associated hydrolase 2
MPGALQAFFLPGPGPAGGHRMAVLRLPQGQPRGAVLHVPAFAEELNKSRRMVALASRALSDAGYAVLQMDLHGCGDSSGEFADTSWDQWLADVTAAADWLRARHDGELWLWGLRAGCLLAAEAARHLPGPQRLLLWQPQTSGRQVLQQFLRLKMAGQMQQGASKGVTEALRRELDAGQVVDIAGYQLGPALARGLEAATLQPPPAGGSGADNRLVWLEVTSREPLALLPAAAAPLAQWRDAGHAVQAHAVAGPPFWQTLEIEEAPALVDASVAAVLAPSPETAAA